MTFLPMNYVRVAHNYTGTSWQNFTGDLSTAQVNLREFSGTHTAALSFYRANMDPSQSSATTVVKKGDKVRIHMMNKSGVWRRTATMKIKNVAVDIDLSKPAGRQNKVTIHLTGTGVAGVAGTGASKGVATVPELADVIAGAPFEINGNGYALTTSAWTGTAHLSTSTETDIDGGPTRTNLSTNPSLETSTAGYAAGANNTIAQDATWADQGTKSLKITPTGASNDTYAEFNIATTIGQTYTVSATCHLSAAQTGTLNTRARAIYCLTTTTLGTPAPNAAGDTRVAVTFTATATTSTLRLYNGSTNVGESVWWDAILGENTTVAGTGLGYFDGASNASAGTTTAPGTSTEVAAINEASAFDQVILTRDSNPGTIGYEDPAGRVQVYDSASYRTAAPKLTLGPAQYSDIDQQFDMSHIINVVQFKYFERVHPARRPSRVVEHDITYQDSASVAKYGPFRKVIKTHKKSNFATHASAIFSRNADPAAVPASVLVPIRQASELLPGYEDGHYVGEKVKVTLPDNVTTYTCRVARIAHTITPTTWAVQVFLREQNLIQRPREHTKVSSEVANTPDGLILTTHLDDGAVTSPKTSYPVIGSVSATAPTSPKTDDLWVDSGNGNTLKRWNGASWVTIQDAGIAAAQATANGKNKVTYSTSDPGAAANTAGDVWFTYSGTVVSKQWQGNGGTSWTQVTIGNNVIAALDAGKITTGILTGIIIQGAVFQTKTGLGTAGVSGMKLEDDLSGGVIKFYTGATGETAGYLNPNLVAGQPQVRLQAPGTTSYVRVPYVELAAGTSNSRLDIKGDLTNVLGALSVSGSLTIQTGATPIRGIDFKAQSVTTNASGDVTVNHNLGLTPGTVLFTPHTGSWLIFRISGITATNFTIRVFNVGTGAVHASATFTLGWMAIT